MSESTESLEDIGREQALRDIVAMGEEPFSTWARRALELRQEEASDGGDSS